MDKKEQALKKINIKLDEIKEIYKECEKIADEADVLFYFTEPLQDSYVRYYPKNYIPEPDTTEARIAENYGRDSIAGMWLSSSDDCS
jgi:hypothetical protein